MELHRETVPAGSLIQQSGPCSLLCQRNPQHIPKQLSLRLHVLNGTTYLSDVHDAALRRLLSLSLFLRRGKGMVVQEIHPMSPSYEVARVGFDPRLLPHSLNVIIRVPGPSSFLIYVMSRDSDSITPGTKQAPHKQQSDPPLVGT